MMRKVLEQERRGERRASMEVLVSSAAANGDVTCFRSETR